MKLTDAKLRSLTDQGRHFDGRGLYLEVTKAGRKYWRLKYRFGGKEKLLAFGVYPSVGLKEAREATNKARQILEGGEDPGELRKAGKAKVVIEQENTLEIITREWLAHQAGRWSELSAQRITASLEGHVFPFLGDRPIASIKAGEVMEVVKRVEAKGAGDQAGRVMQRLKAVFRWAVIHRRIEENPLLDLVPSEILKPRQVTHRPALADRELPTFLKKLADYEGDPNTVQALHLLMLTATRPGEVRGARWNEFDTAARIWVIPAERMKMRTEHRVPLSRQALKVLKIMSTLSGEQDLVFPSPYYPSKSLSENTFNSAMARMGYKGSATAHGFRALFSTVANESGWNPDVIERQLAHIERNGVRAAYHRSTYMQDREDLLQWWGDYLDARSVGKTLKKSRKSP